MDTLDDMTTEMYHKKKKIISTINTSKITVRVEDGRELAVLNGELEEVPGKCVNIITELLEGLYEEEHTFYFEIHGNDTMRVWELGPSVVGPMVTFKCSDPVFVHVMDVIKTNPMWTCMERDLRNRLIADFSKLSTKEMVAK